MAYSLSTAIGRACRAAESTTLHPPEPDPCATDTQAAPASPAIEAAAPAARPGCAEGGPPLIFGIHAVEAALANPSRAIAKLYLTDNAERRLQPRPWPTGSMAHERVLPKDLDRRLGPDTVHQGALIEAEPLPEPTLAELVERGAGPAPHRARPGHRPAQRRRHPALGRGVRRRPASS